MLPPPVLEAYKKNFNQNFGYNRVQVSLVHCLNSISKSSSRKMIEIPGLPLAKKTLAHFVRISFFRTFSPRCLPKNVSRNKMVKSDWNPVWKLLSRLSISQAPLYCARCLIGSQIIESDAYCNQIMLVPLYLNSTQNALVNWIIRLLLSLLA